MRSPRRGARAALQAFVASLAAASAYEWDYRNQGRDWDYLCQGRQQSPIDIEPSNVKTSDLQVRTRYGLWRGQDVVPEATGHKDLDGNDLPSFRFAEGSSPGYVQVGTGYEDFDEYTLTSVEVHSPSEHTFMQASWPIELQLWHSPRPLKSIGRLSERVGDLEDNLRQVDGKLDLLAAVEADLETEFAGKSPKTGLSPSARYHAAGDDMDWMGRQTMGLIQETKGRIETVTHKLRKETYKNKNEATHLAQEANRIAQAQNRKYAAHLMVISLFVRRASSELFEVKNQSVTNLIEWVADGISTDGRTPGNLHAGQLFASAAASGAVDELYGYEGSLTRPPCTPNVRWFVTSKPLAVSVEVLERLLQQTRLGARSDGVVGDAREIQAIGSERGVWRVPVSDALFKEPALNLPEDNGAAQQGPQKWAMVQRYCKVLLLCSILLLVSPFLFLIIKSCRSCLLDADDEQDLGELRPGSPTKEKPARRPKEAVESDSSMETSYEAMG